MSRTQSIKVGPHTIVAITDGEFEFGAELFPGTDESTIHSLLAKAGADRIETNFNAFVIKSPGRTMLVDAGPRDLFGPTCGNLPAGLTEAGVATDDITHILLTHLHPDHIAGVISADGEQVFSNATLLVNETEHAFWAREESFGDESMDQWQQMAKAVLGAYDGKLELFNGDADLGAGVSALALPGHTPGHSGFRVDDGDQSFVMACDIVHAQALQIADPEISIAFDIDADAARATRKRALDMIASDQLIFSGGHLISPKFGKLVSEGSGYQLQDV